jgi:HAD superfamily hydrolase (TIGR01509 family)
MAIRGVLLDSGDVLIRPRAGALEPSVRLRGSVVRHHPEVVPDPFEESLQRECAFLDSPPWDGTRSREAYHRVILGELGVTEPSAELLVELDRPLDLPPVETFPEVTAVLADIRSRGLSMAMVTDNWGTSETVRALHDQVGTGEYFDVIVVSQELGCIKPDPRMYRTASDGLGLAPEECFFVDDDPHLVAAALDLGYQGAALHRDGYERDVPPGLTTITTLDELLPLL